MNFCFLSLKYSFVKKELDLICKMFDYDNKEFKPILKTGIREIIHSAALKLSTK